MTRFLQSAASLLSILGFLLVVGWILRRIWERSDDRPALMLKWLLTLADLAFVVFIVGPMFREFGYTAAFGGVPLAAFSGLALALIWVPSIVDSLGRKFGQLYDGGDTAPDPEPFFSIVEARRKQGKYAEAEQELRLQLEQFPTHFRGQMLLAELQAQDQRDLAAAAATIERIVQQPGHAPKNLAFALTRLADWQLKYANDREAARAALERIVNLMPDSPESHAAWQRLAHLTPEAMLNQAQERPTFAVPESPPRLGVLTEPPVVKIRGSDPQERVNALVAQLDQFPNDNQTREELALLYAGEFQRPDLAAEQLEQLIAQPFAPAVHVARWLNLVADLCIHAGDVAGARQTLQRLIDRDPSGAAATLAKRRLATIDLEARAKKESQVVQLGSYEQRLGLKGGPYRA